MRDRLLDLFTEIAILEHLARSRFGNGFSDKMEAGHFGILNYFIRTNRPPDTVAGIAFAFQEDETVIAKRVEHLRSLNYVTVVDALKPRDSIVDVTAEGRLARDAQLTRMAPYVMEAVAEIPAEDLAITAQTLKEIRLVMDNLPDR